MASSKGKSGEPGRTIGPVTAPQKEGSRHLPPAMAQALGQGVVLPAVPLALTPQRRLDERRQRALCRYYLAAGAGGLAAGVHTTQFAIRDHGLLRPVLDLVADEVGRCEATPARI